MQLIFSICFILSDFYFKAEASELDFGNIHFYGYYNGGEKGGVLHIDNEEILLKKGETKRLEFKKFYDGEHIAIDTMDVELEVTNNGDSEINNVEISMVLIPKVAHIKYFEGQPPGAIDEEKTEKGAKWDKSILKLHKNIVSVKQNSVEKVVFEKIPLTKIIDDHFNENKWPVMLRFTINRGSQSTGEGVSETLRIPLPPY